MTDITEDHTWKDEVEELNQRIFLLNQELVASQLMTGLILQETGPVKVGREAIAKQLPGKQIKLDDVDEAIVFSLVDSND